MSIVLNKVDSYVKALPEFKKNYFNESPKWIGDIKEQAIQNFSRLGFPTLKDEDWRFTNLAPISRNTFHIPEDGTSAIGKDTVDQYLVPGLDCHRLVFVNGKFVPGLSEIVSDEEGIIIKSLKDALNSESDLVQKHLAQYADFENESFTSLNTAFFEDGVFIYVSKSQVVDKPVYILNISTSKEEQTLISPRNLFVLEDNAEVKIVEQYASTGDNVYFSNVVTEFVLGENANAEHYLLELESTKAFNISTLRIQQARSSNIRSHSILMGGSIVRNNVHPVLNGEGCNSDIFGLYLSNDRQHMDNFMKVEHAKPHSDSRQFYNGILDDRSRGVFHGRIIVHEGAMQTDAKQTNRNLLLTDTAQIDTKPQLEIYNHDVKCTHGATIGQMDDEAIFYLKSRGVPEKEARSIMLQAFTNETIDKMSLQPVKDKVESLVLEWFENSFAKKKQG